jgi:hypothetical protein
MMYIDRSCRGKEITLAEVVGTGKGFLAEYRPALAIRSVIYGRRPIVNLLRL